MKETAGYAPPPPSKERVFVVFPPSSIDQLLRLFKEAFVKIDIFQREPADVIVATIFPPGALDVIARTLDSAELNVPNVQTLPLRSKVPLVRNKARVEPSVIASASCHVPPTPLNVTGKSIVLPLLVMVLVPDVEVKVMVLLPAPTVIPDARVSEPLMVKLA